MGKTKSDIYVDRENYQIKLTELDNKIQILLQSHDESSLTLLNQCITEKVVTIAILDYINTLL